MLSFSFLPFRIFLAGCDLFKSICCLDFCLFSITLFGLFTGHRSVKPSSFNLHAGLFPQDSHFNAPDIVIISIHKNSRVKRWALSCPHRLQRRRHHRLIILHIRRVMLLRLNSIRLIALQLLKARHGVLCSIHNPPVPRGCIHYL